jgi:uracil-DNA glycosylase
MLDRACDTAIDAIWIGRDLGYRGGRRTGFALTDDVHLKQYAERWGLAAERPTTGEAVAERTAAIIWRVLNQVESQVFLWNVFPLHPHNSREPFSNRHHNARERDAGVELLNLLIQFLRPQRIVAIGGDAALAASRFAANVPVLRVRHPSYGGQNEFLSEMARLYGVNIS